MANTLTNIMPKILARGLQVLREQCIMPGLVNTDYSTEAAMKGDTIDIPIPSAVAAVNVAPATVPISVDSSTPGKVQITLDNWKQNTPVHLTDKQMVEIDKSEHFLPGQLEEAVKGLANAVNQSIWTEYYNVYGAVGTAGTTPFDATGKLTAAVNARKLLHSQLCPRDNRRAVLDYDAEAALLKLAEISDTEKTGEKSVKREGEIGRKLGFDWYTDDHVTSHTAGTPGGTPVTNSSSLAIGDVVVPVDGITANTGDYHKGDIITFTGHSQQYAVLALATANASGEVDLSIAPGLVVAPGDGVAVALVATHVANLAFHRDAFALAVRPLQQSTADLELGSRIMTMQDSKSGLPLRLEVSRQHKQVVWEFDILWGVRLVQPAYAVRIMG
jgi:hypothetical protein